MRKMSYTTTKIKRIKSYPTYQFHAFTNSHKYIPEGVYKICILETFRWLKSRLNDFDEVPEEFNVPEPESYAEFDISCLHSFSINLGFNIDVVYIEEKGIWAFNITESDAGANIGTDSERLPVQGRTFSTDISFRLHNDCVEAGVRTICSEPIEETAGCEVFRPALVKAIALNKDIGFRNKYVLDGNVINISSKDNAELFVSVCGNKNFDFPMILVAESGYEMTEENPATNNGDLSEVVKIFENFKNSSFSATDGIELETEKTKQAYEVDISRIELEKLINVSVRKVKSRPETSKKNDKGKSGNFSEVERVKQKSIDYNRLAMSMTGFALVFYVSGNCFKIIRNKLGIELKNGDITVVHHGNIVNYYSYESYCSDYENFHKIIKKENHALCKRSAYNYGSIKFSSDARIIEFTDKHENAANLNEKVKLLISENEALRKRLKEEKNRNTDAGHSEEQNRLNVKKIHQVETEKEGILKKLESVYSERNKFEAAYKNMSGIIGFYKYKCKIAESYPNKISDVCDWAESQFSDDLIITSGSRNTLKKYAGALDLTMLCDGLFYLSGYAKYKRNEISEDTLNNFYAEKGHWEAERCGTEALKMYQENYTVTVGSERYVLDYHIKYGIKAQQLIRVYFCWDEKSRKVIIGSMPGHLPTVKQKT